MPRIRGRCFRTESRLQPGTVSRAIADPHMLAAIWRVMPIPVY